MKAYEWQDLSTYSKIKWYDMEAGELLMKESDPVFRKFVGYYKELIIRSTVNGSGAAIFKIFRNEMYDLLEEKVFICGGNKIMYDIKIEILISLVICHSKEETFWIKSGVIKPLKISNKLVPAYKRLPDLSFKPDEVSPGSAITRYIRYNTI